MAAYGALVRGSPTALFPWTQSPTNSGQPSAPSAQSGTQRGEAQTFAIPTPRRPVALPEPGVRPIIFLPGILGSYLWDGTEVWPNLPGIGSTIACSTQSVNPSAEQRVFASMALSPDGTPLPGTTVGVANGVDQPLDGNLGGAITADTYTKDCGFLLNIFGDLLGANRTVSENVYAVTASNASASGYTVVQSDDPQGLSVCAGQPRCFVPIGYDWRLSAETNAAKVLPIIEEVLSITGADRVDILAHSQGGLVAEAITKLPEAVGKIYRIVTLGTPFLGAPKALTELLEQYPCQDPPACYLNPAVVQSLIENYPGVMELLPSANYYAAYSTTSPPYTTVQSEVTHKLASLGPPASPQGMQLVDAAEQMHEQDDSWAPLDPTVGLLRMIGYDADDASPNCPGGAPCVPSIYLAGTPGQTIVNAFTSDGSLASPPVPGDGDGTVPLFSASLYNPQTRFDDRGTGRNVYWCGLSHMGLAQDTAVWQSAEAYLEGGVSYAADALGAYCPDGSLGSIANLGLVLAAPSEPAGAVPPGPTSDTACSPSTATSAPIETSITIVDDTAGPLDLSWYDPTCQEQKYATIQPQIQLTQGTYAGQIWHLRSNGSLIGTIHAGTKPQTVVAT